MNPITRRVCTKDLYKLGETLSVIQEHPFCIFCFSSVWPDPSHNQTLVGNLQRHIIEGSDSTRLRLRLYFLMMPVCNGAEDNPATILLVQSWLNYWRAALGSAAPLSSTPRWRKQRWEDAGALEAELLGWEEAEMSELYLSALRSVIKYWDATWWLHEYCKNGRCST